MRLVTVLRPTPVVTFLGVKPIEEGLSRYPKNPTVWILRVDVLMKKQSDMPIATTKGFGGVNGVVVFIEKRLKCVSPTFCCWDCRLLWLADARIANIAGFRFSTTTEIQQK